MSPHRAEVLYVGAFKLPDRDAAAVRVTGIARALEAGGYRPVLIGEDEARGEEPTPLSNKTARSLCAVVRRGLDAVVTGQSYFDRLAHLDWSAICAVICYPGPAVLVWRLLRTCRSFGLPLVIDSTEWYDRTHVLGGRFGPLAADSELRMRCLQPLALNVICISSYLARYYSHKGCNVVRVPPLIESCVVDNANVAEEQADDSLTLVYFGVPGRKERLPEIVDGIRRARALGLPVKLRLVGITRHQLDHLMSRADGNGDTVDGVTCYGFLPRPAALKLVAASDFSVILRPNLRFAEAGFPTKFAESLAAGVPVMANATSDIPQYLRDGIEGFLLKDASATAVERAVVAACSLSRAQRRQMRQSALQRARESFDYRIYVQPIAEFLHSAKVRP